MEHRNQESKNTGLWKWLTILLLAVYLFTGLRIFRDYEATPDEINQIEAGHITWNALAEHFGREEERFSGLPKLKNYYNRYYGQAATFPTVIMEALRGFSMDISTILRLRHLWNFLLFFSGTVCMGLLTRLRFRRSDVCFFLVLLYILTPRLFGDAFYNDRDTLLISLLWAALLSFEFLCRKPCILSAAVFAFCFALAINTRFFALVLLPLLLIRFFRRPEKKGCFILALLLTIVFWYEMTPVFWGNFIREFRSAFQIFASGRQRTQETGGLASVLYFGKYFPENDLPFYYLPLWIFISTPILPQLLCAFGLVRSFRQKSDLTNRFMEILLCGGILAVMLIRPVQYNGWRHFYFFHVPLFWFAGAGLNFLLSFQPCTNSNAARHSVRWVTIGLVCLSSGIAAVRLISLHPYEYLYLNSFFQSREADFDRDYWRLSTGECLKWLGMKESEEIVVGEVNESLDNCVIGLLPGLRDRIIIQHYNALHRYPQQYLIFNYSGSTENQAVFPLYEPVHAVERDGVKLAEIFQRIPDKQLPIKKMIPDVPEITAADPDTEWRSKTFQNPEDELILEFAEPVKLSGLSLLPGSDEREYARSPEVSISTDGKKWTQIPLKVSGLFDLSFPETETRWLRIRNTDPADVFWSIRKICFYE